MTLHEYLINKKNTYPYDHVSIIVDQIDEANKLGSTGKQKTHSIKNARSMYKAVDELDFAANWDRAFVKIHTDIKWINTFAVINEVAAFKILKRLMKNHFKSRDNIINKNLTRIVKAKQFAMRSLMGPIIKDFKQVYANFFCDGDLELALKKLDKKTKQV